ncbi:hypothetical protein BKI52_19390 [marine bacterium AO1-C]|nr:hypothetical protein BKI52_19390 [marine bacterium AO1-C]
MINPSTPKYTFLSWFRRGMSNFISQTDDPSANGSLGTPTLPVELELDSGSSSSSASSSRFIKSLDLVGPGNVVGIQEAAIIRTEPVENSNNFTPSSLAFIEFYDEDFPWRYTPATPNGNKLRPWVFLLVLKEDEYTLQFGSGTLPFIDITGPTLDIPPEDIWAWAHVQVNQQLMADNSQPQAMVDELDALLEQQPNRGLSRIICPRRLEPDTAYTAFLVPSFEVGRLAGLGMDYSQTGSLKPSWTQGTPVQLPVYHRWNFSTADAGDFETLARKLQPTEIDSLPLKTLNIESLYNHYQSELPPTSAQMTPVGHMPQVTVNPMPVNQTGLTMQNQLTQQLNQLSQQLGNFLQGQIAQTGQQFTQAIGNQLSQLGPTRKLQIESALMPDGVQASPWPNSTTDGDIQDAMQSHLAHNTTTVADENSDPIVNLPPLYGKWYHDHQANPLSKNDSGWIHQLNLHPRHRMAAGLGAKIVRDHQDKFMDFAWEQIGEIQELNRKIYQVQLAEEVGNLLYQKHFANRSSEELVATTGNLQKRIVQQNASGTATIHQQVKKSALTEATTDSGFYKARRSGGKTGKKLSRQLKPLFINNTTPVNVNNYLVSNINDTTSVANQLITGALPKMSPYDDGGNYGLAVGYNQNASDTTLAGSLGGGNVISYLNTSLNSLQADAITELAMTDAQQTLLSATDPLRTIARRQLAQMQIASSHPYAELITPSVQKVQPILAAPRLPVSLYNYLLEISQEFIVPDLSDLGDNFAGLLTVNQSFIEQVMVGANDEMARELLWRGFPTDQRGTYFQYFWNTKDNLDVDSGTNLRPKDIDPIHTWGNTPLGTHKSGGSSIIALVIKGELIQNYPNTMIYAHKAIAQGNQRILDPNINSSTVKFPLFRADLVPNVLVLGFEMSVQEALTGEGWYFMFKERAGETKFGLDETTSLPALPLTSWDELAWGHLGSNATPASFVDLTVNLAASANEPTWAADAASMAHILYQSPVSLGLHAELLLP